MKGIKLIALFCFIMLFYFACKNRKEINIETPIWTPNKSYDTFSGLDYKGNYLWTATMEFSSKKLANYLLTHNIMSDNETRIGLTDYQKLVYRGISSKDIDTTDYCIVIGLGNSAIEIFNKELRRKFGWNSFQRKLLLPGNKEIVSMSYFQSIPILQHKFQQSTMMFSGKCVASFRAIQKDRFDLYILDYHDNDHFIIAFRLNDKSDRMYFAKGYPMGSPDEILSVITEKAYISNIIEDYEAPYRNPKYNYKHFAWRDYFEAPMIGLSGVQSVCSKTYEGNNMTDLIVKSCENYTFFRVDESGIDSNEFPEGNVGTEMDYPPPEKRLILNKPYWIIMHKYNSKKPYLIIGINNTNLMKTISISQ